VIATFGTPRCVPRLPHICRVGCHPNAITKSHPSPLINVLNSTSRYTLMPMSGKKPHLGARVPWSASCSSSTRPRSQPDAEVHPDERADTTAAFWPSLRRQGSVQPSSTRPCARRHWRRPRRRRTQTWRTPSTLDQHWMNPRVEPTAGISAVLLWVAAAFGRGAHHHGLPGGAPAAVTFERLRHRAPVAPAR
jgi:hypothetical protein